jgi:putative MATE family efflux protein
MMGRMAQASGREVARLAIPAFLALIAEPLFLLADSAIVGHLGTAPLAGLGLASTVLMTVVGIFVFLAYGTTAVVARQIGAGSRRGAVEVGVDGAWLSIVLGLAAALLVGFGAEPLCRALGGTGDALEQAVSYLRVAAGGIPAMLVVLACTGVFRGLQDTRTPLVASVLGFAANAVLNVVLVYGLELGIAGSAWGTVVAQWGMALGLLLIMARYARVEGAAWRAHPRRVLSAALGGVPLLVRTLALRAVLVLTTWVAAGLGDVPSRRIK